MMVKCSKKKVTRLSIIVLVVLATALATSILIININFSMSLSPYCAQDGSLKKNILDQSFRTPGASNKSRTDHLPDDLFPSPQAARDNLVTIAVDRYHSCPKECRFVHVLFPPWVRFRYIDFGDETDLAGSDDSTTHLLILARTNIHKLGVYAAERRKLHNKTTGLFHMADERIFGKEIDKVYLRFDYVLRNYYSDAKPFYGMTLHALGNYSCGESSEQLPHLSPSEPRWGVHWVHLDSHSMSIDMQRSGASTWPISKRPVNCSFIGRRDVKRSVHERSQMEEAVGAIPELNCTVEYTKGFLGGSAPFYYFNRDLGTAKIGLAPRGSGMETHRLAEVLRMGLVPAIKDAPYLHATFRALPGIIGENWTIVAEQMKWYLTQAPDELERLAGDAAQFSQDLSQCMKQDMNIILQSAFGILKTTPRPFRLFNRTNH